MRVRYRSGTVWQSGQVWYFRAGWKKPAIRLGQFKNATQARKAAQPYVNQANEIEALPIVTFGSVAEKYRAEEMPKRESTARMYRSWLKLWIEPKWSEVAVTEVKANEVKLWLESLPLGGKSKSEIKGLIGRVLRCAMLWRIVPVAPNEMTLFQVKNRKRKKHARILTVAEFVALVGALNEPFRTMAKIAQYHGLGASEVLGLKWQDVDWLGSSLGIQRGIVNQVEDTTKTSNREAKLPLADSEIQMLKDWRKQTEFTDAEQFVFSSPHSAGELPYHYTSFMWKLGKACKSAGITKVTTHTFRHTFRAWGGEAGIPLATLKDLMRHGDIRTTMNVYGGTVPDALRDAHSKIVGMIERR